MNSKVQSRETFAQHSAQKNTLRSWVVDKFLMESFSLFYDNFVSDKMINTMVDSRTLFTPIEYEFNVRYDAVRKN